MRRVVVSALALGLCAASSVASAQLGGGSLIQPFVACGPACAGLGGGTGGGTTGTLPTTGGGTTGTLPTTGGGTGGLAACPVPAAAAGGAGGLLGARARR